MSLAGECQLPGLITPHSLNEKIEAIIFPLSINYKSAIGRPTGLFKTSSTRSHDLALMRV